MSGRQRFPVLGLERLDYDEATITPEYEWRADGSRASVALDLGLRRYRDRRASDTAGDPLIGTHLEYRSYALAAEYRKSLTPAHALAIKGAYGVREDNAVGYDDRTRAEAALEWTYRIHLRSELTVGCEWSRREFRNRRDDPTVNDDAPARDGYSLVVAYTRPLPFASNDDVTLRAETAWESFDNRSDTRLSYDRIAMFVGLRARL
jgi:hypothetical protein